MTRSQLTLPLVLLTSACGSSTPTGTVDDVEPDVALDVGGLDTSEDIAPFDISDDGPDVADTADGSGDAVDGAPDVDPGAPLGDPCDDDGDCAEGVCVDIVAGAGLCALPCIDDEQCPRDFDCVLIDTSDSQRVCLARDLCIDADGDDHGVGPGCRGIDCDDDDDSVNVSADEICDGADNDCDDLVDDAPVDMGGRCETGFPGECALGRLTCTEGLPTCVGENVPSDEVCDDRDNDCDGEVDEAGPGVALTRRCYDGDPALLGTGVCAEGIQTCTDGGYSACFGQTVASGEICDDLDNDCDGESDEGLALVAWYPDVDRDTFGDSEAEAVLACARPAGAVENRGDCDDSSDAVRPGAAEVPGDGVDQNCDGAEFCFADGDGDGYRPPGAASVVSLDVDCDDDGEATAAAPAGDCNDALDTTYPGAPELCDGANNDCDTRTDEGAACYPIGAICVDDSDCATLLCEAFVCTRPTTCRDDGTCPDRVATASGVARVASPRFSLAVTASSGIASPVLDSPRFTLTVGSGVYTEDP